MITSGSKIPALLTHTCGDWGLGGASSVCGDFLPIVRGRSIYWHGDFLRTTRLIGVWPRQFMLQCSYHQARTTASGVVV